MATSNLVKDQAVILKLKALFAGITVANSYRTNIGSKVYLWRDETFGKSETFIVSIEDGIAENITDPEQVEELDLIQMPVAIRIACKNQTDTWKFLTDSMIDVREFLGAAEETMRELYDDIKFHLTSYGIVDMVDVPEKIGEAEVLTNITYTVKRWLNGETTYTV